MHASSALLFLAGLMSVNAAPILDGVVGGLTGTVSSVVGSVPAGLQATCSLDYQKCTVTITGEIENMLTDGANYSGRTTVSAWMQDGHSYASLDAAGRMPAPVPMDITCDGKAGVCRTTVVGNVTQVFSNGKQISVWGWLTPEGRCTQGVCTGSVSALGDPAYKV